MKLRDIFGKKSKREILAMVQQVPVNVAQFEQRKGNKGKSKKSPPNVNGKECFYCDGKYNVGGKSHLKRDCTKREEDRAKSIFRRDIFSKPNSNPTPISANPVKRQRAEVLVDAVKKRRVEVMVESTNEEASSKILANENAVNNISNERSVEGVSTNGQADEGSSTGNPSDWEDDLTDEVRVDQVATMKVCAERIKEMCIGIEKEVRKHYPFLLRRVNVLTDNDWVLDSGCGHGLSPDSSKFTRLRTNSSYIFTFGEGTKYKNQ